MKRVIFASSVMADRLKAAKQKKLSIYSFFPIDRGNCECVKLVSEWKDRFMLMHPKNKEDEILRVGHLVCPKDKTGYNRYIITCNNCNEGMGYCYATDDSLSDFFDFHYVQWTNGTVWKGCLPPNISPSDEKLTLECTCGQDPRDFRANQTLPAKTAVEIETANRRGREYGQSNSKFNVAYG